MNRRRFLKLGTIGLAAATAVAALPKIVASLPPIMNPEVAPTTYTTYVMGADAMHALSLADIRRCVEQLKSTHVHPTSQGMYLGPVHPDWVDEAIRYKWVYKWNGEVS